MISSHIAAIGLTAIAFVGCVVPVTDRTPPATIRGSIVTTPVIAPGDDLVIELDGEIRKGECTSVVSWRVMDSAHTEITPPQVNRRVLAPVGPDIRKLFVIPLPKSINIGPAIVSGTIDYSCNWSQDLWPVTVSVKPQAFTVTTKSQGKPNG